MDSTRVKVDPETVQNLMETVTRLKENEGFIDANAIWTKEQEIIASRNAERLDNSLCSDPRSKSLYNSLRQLKTSRNALRALLRSSEDHLVQVQREYEPFILFHGVSSLPDELLSRVFEMGCDSDRKNFSTAVSHVCQRFRAVALHNPRLWSEIRNDQVIPELEAFISRSKAVALSVSVNNSVFSRPKPCLKEFLTIASQHSQRWGEFRYTIDNIYDYAESNFIVLTSLANLKLPRLKHLVYVQTLCNWNIIEIDTPPFFFLWSMPNLTSFIGKHVIPPIPLMRTLVSCELHLAGDNPKFEFEELVLFLDNQSSLKSLSLSFSGVSCQFDSRDRQNPPVALLGLDYLSVVVDCTTDEGFVRRFFQTIFLPKLSTLSIEICHEDIYRALPILNYTNLVTALFPRDNPYPALRSVHFLAPRRLTFKAEFMEIFFGKTPSLHHLSIHAPGVQFPENDLHLLIVPPLRTFCLAVSGEQGAIFTRWLIAVLRLRPTWTEFQKLQVKSCVTDKDYLQYFKESLKDKFEHVL